MCPDVYIIADMLKFFNMSADGLSFGKVTWERPQERHQCGGHAAYERLPVNGHEFKVRAPYGKQREDRSGTGSHYGPVNAHYCAGVGFTAGAPSLASASA